MAVRKKIFYNKEKNGITLIALVVTIVILIILAVISINAILGEDGLIASAERGSIEHTHATVWEAMEMEYSNYWIDKVMLGGNLVTYLQDSGIIEEELKGAGYVINVEKLLGTRMSLGNGTDGENDVYKLEEVINGTKYSVKYYGPSGNRELGILGDSISSLVESDNPNFEITKEVTSKPIKGDYYTVGDTIEYTITATNKGDVTIKDIQITDTLTAGSGTYKPGDEHLVLSKGNSEKIGAKDGCWTISSLDSQETATIIYTYTVQQKDIEAGKIVDNVITKLEGVPQPTVPRGHKIPEVEVPTVPEEKPNRIKKPSGGGNNCLTSDNWELSEYTNSNIRELIESWEGDYLLNIYKVADFNNETEKFKYIEGLDTYLDSQGYTDIKYKYGLGYLNKEEVEIFTTTIEDYILQNEIEPCMQLNPGDRIEPQEKWSPEGEKYENGIYKDYPYGGMYLCVFNTAYSETYTITSPSELVELPFFVYDEDSDDGEFNCNFGYFITMGGLMISRENNINITSTMEELPEGNAETVIYKVTATIDGRVEYSNIDSIIFEESGTKEITFEGIPTGSEVTIEQIYTGTYSDCITDKQKTVHLDSTSPGDISFTNRYNERLIRGGSLKNSFMFNDEGRWDWIQENIGYNNCGLEIEEEFNSWTKHIRIFSNESAEPRYIRAKVFWDDMHNIECSSEKWTQGDDGYYYYNMILGTDENADGLLAQIKNIEEDPDVGEQFNVIVVYETVPIQMNDDGPYANWNM